MGIKIKVNSISIALSFFNTLKKLKLCEDVEYTHAENRLVDIVTEDV